MFVIIYKDVIYYLSNIALLVNIIVFSFELLNYYVNGTNDNEKIKRMVLCFATIPGNILIDKFIGKICGICSYFLLRGIILSIMILTTHIYFIDFIFSYLSYDFNDINIINYLSCGIYLLYCVFISLFMVATGIHLITVKIKMMNNKDKYSVEQLIKLNKLYKLNN